MRTLFIWGFITIFSLTGCDQLFTNKRTSRIYDLNTECLRKEAWKELDSLHSVAGIKDSVIISKIKEIHQMPFSTTVYYFSGSVPELIAVANRECVRYVYNSRISDNILDGLSPELSDQEKEKIGTIIQSVLKKYQCDEEKIRRLPQEWDE